MVKGQKRGGNRLIKHIYQLIDPGQTNKHLYQIEYDDSHIGDICFEKRTDKVGDEDVTTTCQVKLHTSKRDFATALGKKSGRKVDPRSELEYEGWTTLWNPHNAVGTMFGHPTISNIEEFQVMNCDNDWCWRPKYAL